MGVYGVYAYVYGVYVYHNFNNNADFIKAIRHIMHMVVLLLLILILISKTVRRLTFRVFSKIWKDSSIEQICVNGLAVRALAFKIEWLETSLATIW